MDEGISTRENHQPLLALPARELLKKFGGTSHKPGAGSASALQGLLSAHLLLTVVGLTNKGSKRQRLYAEGLPRLLSSAKEVRDDICPALEELLQRDSDQYDKVVRARTAKEKERDPAKRRVLAEAARRELIPATEIPMEIGGLCVKLAEFGIYAVDHGYKSASGDSGVAVNAAISALAGCIDITDLNLLYFENDDWTDSIRVRIATLRAQLRDLESQVRTRRAKQQELSDRKGTMSVELRQIETEKERVQFSDAAIEALAIRFQRFIWINRELIWRHKIMPVNSVGFLSPEIGLEVLRYEIQKETTLGEIEIDGARFEVAAQIDQMYRRVAVSEQLDAPVRNFTIAHELGHALLHNQPVLHRDRPLDGVSIGGQRDIVERQADRFAAFFLMPAKVVRHRFREFFLSTKFRVTEETAFALNERTTDALLFKCKDKRGLARLLASAELFNQVRFLSLADQFRVSVETMAIRLEELDLVELG